MLEQSQAFAEKDGDLEYSHTKFILKKGSQYFYAITNRRYHDMSAIDPLTLDLASIHPSQLWPEIPAAGLTRAPEPLPQDSYFKRPSLLHCDDTEASPTGIISTLLLHEAQICEIVAKSPHPNIAQYLGCVVDHGRITGLCFRKYGLNLSQRVHDTHAFSKKSCLKSIRRGIDHLHTLGIIHCDINPSNILSNGDDFVIGDFDSCAREGEKLGLKAGTIGWTRDNFQFARRENDLYGLGKIQGFLDSSSKNCT